jgi:tRNA A-37 threonylcarbamoyl transferase component Bud32
LSDLPRLDHLARRLFAEEREGEAAALLRDSARWVGGLHAHGIYHGDLKGVNVLVAQQPDGFHFHLIDTDHCRFFAGSVDRRRRIKNLAQLAASIPESVTRADRARWYDLYEAERAGQAGESPADEAGRAALCQEVDALMAEKIVVVDEPIE